MYLPITFQPLPGSTQAGKEEGKVWRKGGGESAANWGHFQDDLHDQVEHTSASGHRWLRMVRGQVLPALRTMANAYQVLSRCCWNNAAILRAVLKLVILYCAQKPSYYNMFQPLLPDQPISHKLMDIVCCSEKLVWAWTKLGRDYTPDICVTAPADSTAPPQHWWRISWRELEPQNLLLSFPNPHLTYILNQNGWIALKGKLEICIGSNFLYLWQALQNSALLLIV